MNANDRRMLQTLLTAGEAGAPETRFPFATQKRLMEQGLVRYAFHNPARPTCQPLVLTAAGRCAAEQAVRR